MSHIDNDATAGAGLPYLTANASQAACFELKSKGAPTESFKTVRGVILGAHRGNSCWQPDNSPLFPGRTVVCKAHDHKQPAVLMKDVTPTERDTLNRLGWTGNCESCGMSVKGVFPGFAPENNMVFLWEKPGAPEPVLVNLTFKGWKGFLVVGAFLARFRRRNSTDAIVEFGMSRVSEGGRNFSVPTCTEVGPVPHDQRQTLADLADQVVPANRYRYHGHDSLPEPSPRPAIPPPVSIEEADIPF